MGTVRELNGFLIHIEEGLRHQCYSAVIDFMPRGSYTASSNRSTDEVGNLPINSFYLNAKQISFLQQTHTRTTLHPK
jgi:hypothetical protein